MLLYIVMLSLSLSIDAFGIGISLGLRSIKFSFIPMAATAVLSFLVTLFAVLFGRTASAFLPLSYIPLISSFMLIFIGIWIIFQAIKKETPKKEVSNNSIHTFIIKSLGITVNIIRTPVSCDIDGSKNIDLKEALYLGTALSLDSFGAGFASGMSEIFSPLIPVFSATGQILFITLGILCGKHLKSFKKDNLFSIISGIIIIIIGIFKLI